MTTPSEPDERLSAREKMLEGTSFSGHRVEKRPYGASLMSRTKVATYSSWLSTVMMQLFMDSGDLKALSTISVPANNDR